MSAKTILIKKYENRRLYDTTNSRYVNLDEVAQMLQQGCIVQVVDAASGEDITRLILTQIIVEDAKATNSSFPLDILRQMVIASGQAGQESTIRYMKAIADFYQNTYRAISPAINPFGFYPGQPMGDQRAANMPDDSTEDARVQDVGKGEQDEVNELKRRLAELEEMVSKLGAKKAPRKKPTK